jgi:hypothetical protein
MQRGVYGWGSFITKKMGGRINLLPDRTEIVFGTDIVAIAHIIW